MNEHNQLSLFDDFESKHSSETDLNERLLEENKINLLALSSIQGVGLVALSTLFEAFKGDFSRIWETSSGELLTYLRKSNIPQSQRIVESIQSQSGEIQKKGEKLYSALTRRKADILFRGTPFYPHGLYDLKPPPPWIFTEGNIDILLNTAIVAVVGTRNPSDKGLIAAKRLSMLLATQGISVLSGLAEGIDGVAHQTAVDYDSPTIAVLGHGIDITFPPTASNLRRQIVEQGGVIVSEYLPKDTYNRERFVLRNRIQAALAHVVSIVEGKARSGTSHTLRFARELKRPVFGVRVGPVQPIPEQELLNELTKQNSPVFSLDKRHDWNQLKQYLYSQMTLERGILYKQSKASHPFRGLLKEIERLSSEYEAKESDFDWLLNQVKLYKDTFLRKGLNDD